MAKMEKTVRDLVLMVEREGLRLPEMQREYVWQGPRVRDLLTHASRNAKFEQLSLGKNDMSQGFHFQRSVYRESGLITPHDALGKTGHSR